MTLKLHNNTYYYTRITPGLSRAFRKKTPKFKKFTICSPFEDPRITPSAVFFHAARQNAAGFAKKA